MLLFSPNFCWQSLYLPVLFELSLEEEDPCKGTFILSEMVVRSFGKEKLPFMLLLLSLK